MMNRRTFTRNAALLGSLSALGLSGKVLASDATPVAPQLPATVMDVNGNEVVVEDVSRIVTLTGRVAETLFLIGLGPNVVATDITAEWPEEAAAVPKIGYARVLAAEPILAFEPTLVIGDTDAGPPEVLQQIADAGVTVLILDSPTTPEASATEIEKIAASVGLPEEGVKLADDIRTRLQEATDLAATSSEDPRVAFLILRGPGVQLLAGAHSSPEGMVVAAGGVNVGTEIGIMGYQPITPEAMVSAAPDYIVAMRGGLETIGGLEGLKAIPGVMETPAGENENFVIVDDQYLAGYGPRTGDAVYDLTIAFHSDIDAELINPDLMGEGDTSATPEASPAS